MLDIIVIILAGGQSSRYKKKIINSKTTIDDKLLSKKGSSTILEHVIREVLSFSNQILIVTREKERKTKYLSLIKQNFSKIEFSKITFLLEESEKPIGPLGGIKTALDYLKGNIPILVIPADLPFLKGSILNKFLKKSFSNPTAYISSIIHSNGQIEHLVLAFMSEPVKDLIDKLYNARCKRSSSIIRLANTKKFIKSSCIFEKDSTNINHLRDIDEYIEDATYFQSNITENIMDSHKEKEIQRSNCIISIQYNKDNNPSAYYLDYITQIAKKNDNQQIILPINQLTMDLWHEMEFYKKVGLLSLSLHCLIDLNNLRNDSIAEQMIDEIKRKLA